MAKHNKKRNVGLIHEQLVRYASEKIVEGKKDMATKAMQILNHHFKEGTELYKEFRLFNSLVHTDIEEKSIARRIIKESRQACKDHDLKKLTQEKSSLIRSINHRIDENSFYDQRIEEYKVFATVQSLLNEWRGASSLSPSDIVKYETVLEEWLTRSKKESTMEKVPQADPLALKIMIEKFNKKYSNFNKHQMHLLECKLLGNEEKIAHQIGEIKEHALNCLDKFYSLCENKVLNDKRKVVEQKIKNLQIDSQDETVKKALIISHLVQELEANDE